MSSRSDWITGAALLLTAGLMALGSSRKKERHSVEQAPVVVTGLALPAARTPESRIGQGQIFPVLGLAAALAAVGGLVMIYILPPPVDAALIPFGPVVLLALAVFVLHVKGRGLALGEPPEDADDSSRE